MPEKTLTEVFTDIADAIREKTGGAEPIAALDMATAISEIPSGPEDLPTNGFVKMYADTTCGSAHEIGWYYYDASSELDWSSHSLTSGSTFWINPLDSDSAEALEQGSIYYIGTQSSEAPAIINLTTDSIYQYGGSNSFEPVSFPSEEGIYCYSNNTFANAMWEGGIPAESGYYYWSVESAYFQAETFEDYVVYRYEGGGYFNNLQAETNNLYWYNDDGLASALENGVTLEDGGVYAWNADHKAFSTAEQGGGGDDPYAALNTEKMYGYSLSAGDWAEVDIPEGAVTWNAASGYFEPASSGDDITANLDSGSDYFLSYNEDNEEWTTAVIPGYPILCYDPAYHDLRPFEEVHSEDELFNCLFMYNSGSGMGVCNVDDVLSWAYNKLHDDSIDESKTYTLAYNNDDGHWTITEN